MDVLNLLFGSAPGIGLATVAVTVAAGFVQGVTGLGFAAVFTPLVVLIAPYPHQVVVLSLFLGAVLSLGVLVQCRRDLQLPRCWPLLAGGLIGTPAGIAVLIVLPARLLMQAIAVLALLVAATGLIGLPRPFRHEQAAVGSAGLFGGFLNGSTSLGGLPPALLVSIQRWPAAHGRAALVAFNLASYLLALASVALTGTVAADIVLGGLWLLPAAALGALLGTVAARRLPDPVFRMALLGVIGASGVAALLTSLRP
ncbi:sulfite exporter TauE/SafE family protein [Pseudonocardia hispaniensis]|uniref:Probable membrane transporter protein n=1 Tax=Pseudonocardia hispaniensis TaxID=904933 RepID=A0ABW1J9B4_9PSEU